MRENYENYYKIFGCGKTQKPCEKKCAETENSMCDNTVLNFCYQPPDCNECIAEHTGYAQAYVPYQESFNISSGEEALCQGTIFPDLIQPYRKDRYPKERCC